MKREEQGEIVEEIGVDNEADVDNKEGDTDAEVDTNIDNYSLNNSIEATFSVLSSESPLNPLSEDPAFAEIPLE